MLIKNAAQLELRLSLCTTYLIASLLFLQATNFFVATTFCYTVILFILASLEVALVNPGNKLIVVVLPAPFWPRRQKLRLYLR